MVYAAPAPEEPPPAPPPPEAALLFAGMRHPIPARRAVLGRSKDCDIQVPDPNVSRRHAEIRLDGSQYVLVDLDSTNGIEVKGERVKRLELKDGTRFTLGSTEIAFTQEPR
jgi:pSer/pThr/pTyr-binding forkhead associated (FHA) protein